MAVNRFPTRELEHAAPSATPEAPQRVSRVVFLTDIPTPYMVAVFEALSELVDLHVVFCAESSSRGPGGEFGELPFSSEVVGGTTIWTEHPDAINYFLSPRIQLAVARRRPEAIISAGYSVPALYANAWAAASRTPLAIQS